METKLYTQGADGDLDLDVDALLLSKFGTPPLQWMQGRAPAYEAQPPRKLSRFEKLPSEIRHEIYSHLGIPVGRYVWVDCHLTWCSNRPHPPSEAHPEEDLYGDEKPRYQHRLVITKIKSTHYWGERADVLLEDSVRIESNSEPPTIIPYCLSELNMSWELLDVCRSIRGEVLDLLFRHANIKFDYELSTKPVFYYRYNTYFEEHYKKGKLQKGVFEHMWFRPRWFNFMTSIYLSDGIGSYRLQSHHPRSLYNDKAYCHRVLTKQSKSTSFVADHCPSLSKLQVDLYLRGRTPGLHYMSDVAIKPKKGVLDSLLLAFLRVIRKCPDLQTITLSRGFRSCDNCWRGHDDAERDPCEQCPLKEYEEGQMLDLRNIPWSIKEEHGRVYIGKIINDLATGVAYELEQVRVGVV